MWIPPQQQGKTNSLETWKYSTGTPKHIYGRYSAQMEKIPKTLKKKRNKGIDREPGGQFQTFIGPGVFNVVRYK